MAIYTLAGSRLNSAFDAHGNQIGTAYDLNGNIIFRDGDIPWIDEVTVEKKTDTSANTNYYVITIPQTRSNFEKQYPFVYAPNGADAGTQSTLAMNRGKGFELAINAGIFYTGYLPIGLTIQDGSLIQQGQSSAYALTIDGSGRLDYAQPNTDGATLIANGTVSAVVGFCPIIVDYVGVDQSIYKIVSNYDQHSQRQIIGQFNNGDYCIITGEGRGFDSSTGWTIPQAIGICEELGLRFAYNLDGGGSTETVIGDTQLNKIYEGTTGRIVPTYIVFNGTDRFFVPSN